MATIGEIHEKEELSYIIEWKIPNFSRLSEKHTSPSFFFANISWFLSVYPNGESWNMSKGHVNLCLFRDSDFYGLPINLEYTLGLKTVNGHTNPVRKFTHVFDGKNCWKYCNILSRFELLKRRNEIAPLNVVTVVCTMKYPMHFKVTDLRKAVTANCSYCKQTVDAYEDISSHLQKCTEFPIKCTKCEEVVALKNWHDHKCQARGTEGSDEAATTKCSYCKIIVDAQEDISFHLRKCTEFPIQCPKCGDEVALKNCFDHKCQTTGAEAMAEYFVDEVSLTLRSRLTGYEKADTTKCSHCKITLDADEDFSSHLRKCTEFSIKCPVCDEGVTLKDWYGHKCQTSAFEGKSFKIIRRPH